MSYSSYSSYSYMCLSSNISCDSKANRYPSISTIHNECKKVASIFINAIEKKDIDYIVYLCLSIEKLKHIPSYITTIYYYLDKYFKSDQFKTISSALDEKQIAIITNVFLEIYDMAFILQ